MISIFNVLFYSYIHLYAISQPQPNCVSSSIVARVCVFSKQYAVVFAEYLQAAMFFFLFCLFLFSSFYLLCCPRAPLFGHLVVEPHTSQQRHLSDRDGRNSSNRNIKDATRNALKYTFGITGIPAVIIRSESPVFLQ